VQLIDSELHLCVATDETVLQAFVQDRRHKSLSPVAQSDLRNFSSVMLGMKRSGCSPVLVAWERNVN